MMAGRLNWKGGDIKKQMESAIKQGMSETGVAAVAAAQVNAPVDTGALRADITFQAPQGRGDQWSMLWGNFIINYALWNEIGTYRMPGRYYLRRAADQEYPHLAERIGQAFR